MYRYGKLASFIIVQFTFFVNVEMRIPHRLKINNKNSIFSEIITVK